MTDATAKRAARPRLGELLLERGALSPEQVERLLARQEERRRLGLSSRFEIGRAHV
mgnify:CR=1 FL=1